MFLLDAKVVSELRKVQAGSADQGVSSWAETVDAGALFISAITVLELELGILLIERRGERRGQVLRASLEGWFCRSAFVSQSSCFGFGGGLV
jgi:predicted nucleic acid-binding protein